MNTKRPRSMYLYGNAASTCGVAALILISGCSGSTNSSDPTPISRPALSAAALLDDDANSLSFAQAVAAGVIEPTPTVSITDTQNGAQANTETPDAVTGQGSEPLPATGDEPDELTDLNPITDAEPADTSDTVEITEAPVTTPDITEPEVTTPEVIEPVVTEPEVAAVSGDTESTFSSSTTDGFVGEVYDDGTVKVSWPKDLKARGYNVYRQAQYIDTIFGEEWIQSDLYDESYYYEIQAFDAADNLYYVATGLTVDVTGTGRTNPDKKPTNEGLLDNYELVFSDEFNGGSLDTSKWNTSYLWGPDLVINSEEQYYVDIKNDPDFGYNPFQFDGENLVIKTIKTPDSLKTKAQNQPYLSGVITSYDAFKMTYGYVETRAKVPYSKGYWPAFWLLNAYYGDADPEIDIMEFIGDDQDVVYHTYHYFDSEGNLRSTKSEPTVGIDFPNEFHTFAVEWSPSTIVFYVDGIERHRISDPQVSQQDMYIIANTAVGGWWPGSPDASTMFPGEYKIDYIRAYQRTTPYEDFPLFDYITKVPFADDVPGSSPSHKPPFELWPEGYPNR